jgi:hypothetical protein
MFLLNKLLILNTLKKQKPIKAIKPETIIQFLACYLNIPNQISKKGKPKSSRVGKIQN